MRDTSVVTPIRENTFFKKVGLECQNVNPFGQGVGLQLAMLIWREHNRLAQVSRRLAYGQVCRMPPPGADGRKISDTIRERLWLVCARDAASSSPRSVRRGRHCHRELLPASPRAE